MTGMARRGAGRWAAVLGLAFVAALGLALLVLWLYRPSQRPDGVETGGWSAYADLPASLSGGPSARRAYSPAAEVARTWQPDSCPAIVSAHWRPRQGRWPTDIAWMFQFYSPATRRLAVIVVEGGRARLLQETASPYPLPTFDEADWQVDSHAALDAWWGAGGAAFLSTHSEVDLMAQLRALEGREYRLVWTIAGIAGDQVKRLVVDGTTGERVQD
jgi:hypothetical protein